jgi:hypothetical protein
MKKVLGILLLFFTCQLYAQNYTLKGKVTDSNGEPMVFAAVRDTNTSKAVYTGNDGSYSMNLPQGTYVLEYKMYGFKNQIRTVNLTSNQEINIILEMEVLEFEEITIEVDEVQEEINSVEMSTEELSVEEIKEIPAFLGEPDVLNAIKLLPGVSSVGEGSTGFNVRGGNIDQNLILSDNANIYSSSHFFGFFSVFNPDAVSGLKIYKGGMPSKYGERVSSVLTIDQRSGDFSKYTVDGGIGLVSSRLTIGGPIKKEKASFIVSARRTYVDQFFRFATNETLKNTGVYFYDLNTKIDYAINANNYLTFTGYYGRDVFNLDKKTLIFNWGNAFGVLNWKHNFGDYLQMKASLSNTNYNYTLGGDDFFYWNSVINTITEKVDFDYTKYENHLISFGFQNNNHHFRPAKIEARGVLKDLFSNIETPQEWSMENGLYLQDEYVLNDKITLLGGLRYSLYNTFGTADENIYASGKPRELEYITSTKHFAKNEVSSTYMGIEPRFSALYKLDSISSLKFGYNRNLQYMQLVSNTTSGLPLDVWKSADFHLKPLKVNQIAFGYVRGLMKNKIEFTTEVYYKHLADVLDYKNNADLFLNPKLETELVQGKGRSYGLELMMRKKKGKFTGWLSYTLSKTELLMQSVHKSETINNGNWYKASWHKPHDASFVCTYDWSKRFSTSLNFVYATGRAITYPDGKYEIYGVVIPNYSARNQGRLSDYHRLDLSAELKSKKNENRKFQSFWNFSIYNVYSRRNAFSYTFESSVTQEVNVTRLAILGSIFPSVTYNFKF